MTRCRHSHKLTMAAAEVLPGIRDYSDTDSSDGKFQHTKTRIHKQADRKHHEQKISLQDGNSTDSDSRDIRRSRRKGGDDDDSVKDDKNGKSPEISDWRTNRRRDGRRRKFSSDSEDEQKSRSYKSQRKDHSHFQRQKSRSISRERSTWHRRVSRSSSREQDDSRRQRNRDYGREPYDRKARYWESCSPDEDSKRLSDRNRGSQYSKSNRDLYWNKYGSDESGRESSRRRQQHESHDGKSENIDPNSIKVSEKSPAKKSIEVLNKPDENSEMKGKDTAVADGLESLTSRTGGAYIPPSKLRMMQASLTDKTSVAFQRYAWEALKKSINGLINKLNVSNIKIIVFELFKENLIRGRGLLARSIMQAQAASPTFTHVYAALVAIINSKFPQIGELILTRLILQFRRGFRRNSKEICLSATRFVAHLVNQQVAHEVIALEILTLLLENATDDSVEVAIGFLKECGAKLTEVTPRGVHAIFERLRSILHEGQLDKRVQYMIEVMFAIRKDGFKDHPAVIAELDVLEEDDQFTHLISLEEATNGEDLLNVFKQDPEYETTEDKYKTIRKEILDEDSSDDESGEDGKSDAESSEEDEDDEDQTIIDNTETNLISLRRTIYLTIQSSLEFEECAHKLLKMELKPGQEVELCHMILDCCAQQRTYEKFYGLLAQRFCQMNKSYVEPFESIFQDSYDTIHRLETNKLRNVAKLFAHLLYTDAINWMVLSHIKLNEEDTTSSSRIFIKILFQELSEYMGLPKLNERVKDSTLQDAFAGLFPRDNPCNTRFAINFFTSIGLGGLTDELREHLKSQPKVPIVPPSMDAASSSPSSAAVLLSSSSSSNSEESSDSDGESSSNSSSSPKSTRKSKKEISKKRNTSKRNSKHVAKAVTLNKDPRHKKKKKKRGA